MNLKTFFVEKAKRTYKIKSIIRKVTKEGNKIIINVNLEKANFKTKMAVAKKIKSILLIEKSRQIVLEEKLKEDKQFVNLLYSYDINICNPKWLFKQLTNDIIDEVLQDKKRQESDIWICVNEVDLWVEEQIYKYSKDFKTTNIITNHIGKFKRIEKKIYEEEGTLINLSNNKRKSLLKADLILNIDFPKELLNQFAIFDNAVIINLDGDMNIRKKRFKGRTINDYKISLDASDDVLKYIKESHLENYDERDIAQAIEKVPKGKINLMS